MHNTQRRPESHTPGRAQRAHSHIETFYCPCCSAEMERISRRKVLLKPAISKAQPAKHLQRTALKKREGFLKSAGASPPYAPSQVQAGKREAPRAKKRHAQKTSPVQHQRASVNEEGLVMGGSFGAILGPRQSSGASTCRCSRSSRSVVLVRLMQFSIRSLFAVIAGIAVLLGAMTTIGGVVLQPLIGLATTIVLLSAILAAIYSRGRERSFAVGMVLFGMGYFVLDDLTGFSAIIAVLSELLGELTQEESLFMSFSGIHVTVQCVSSLGFAVLGGYIARYFYMRQQRAEPRAAPEPPPIARPM